MALHSRATERPADQSECRLRSRTSKNQSRNHRSPNCPNVFHQKTADCLTVDEEAMMLRYYELQLKDFCEKFEPPMTKMAIVSSC